LQEINKDMDYSKKINKSFLVGLIIVGMIIVIVVLKQEEITFPVKKTITQIGKCGDGICDDFEKNNSNLCPSDCQTNSNPAIADTASISLDYSKSLGTFSPYVFGTNAPPYYDEKGFALLNDLNTRVIWIEAKATEPTDLNDLSQYNFTLLDQEVAQAIAVGVEPAIVFSQPEKKPNDLAHYTTYVKNVLNHLKNGWGNGHRWDIKMVRFGNEPDNTAFWEADATRSVAQSDFFETFAASAKAAKAVDSAIIIDGPGIMAVKRDGVMNDWIGNFLNYCSNNNVSIDVFSFHTYGINPEDFYLDAKAVNEELAKYNKLSSLFGRPKLGNDEWNFLLGDLWSGKTSKEFDTTWAAANNINALINMLDQNLYLSDRYGGPFNGKSNGLLGGCHDFLLTDCDGNSKPAYYAFKGFNELYGTEQVAVSGTDHENFSAIAGKKDNELTIILSNYDLKAYMDKYQNVTSMATESIINKMLKSGWPKIYNKFNLKLTNLPWDSSKKITYERYLVDDNHKLELVDSKVLSGNAEMTFSSDIIAPAVQIIKLKVKANN
jgi:hypothetical protein